MEHTTTVRTDLHQATFRSDAQQVSAPGVAVAQTVRLTQTPTSRARVWARVQSRWAHMRSTPAGVRRVGTDGRVAGPRHLRHAAAGAVQQWSGTLPIARGGLGQPDLGRGLLIAIRHAVVGLLLLPLLRLVAGRSTTVARPHV
jgi:hypothetical protein